MSDKNSSFYNNEFSKKDLDESLGDDEVYLGFNGSKKKQTQEEIVFDRARSTRGMILMATALQLTIEIMEQLPSPYQPISDVADYKSFREYIWDLPNEFLMTTAYPEGWDKKVNFPETLLTQNIYRGKQE
tara:strand:+ start:5253 stop:5642 length:390 start_codon:yes stop_codon:yes gene_type:complete